MGTSLKKKRKRRIFMISFRRKFEGKFSEKFSSLALLYFFKKRINKSPDAIKGPAKQVPPSPSKAFAWVLNQ